MMRISKYFKRTRIPQKPAPNMELAFELKGRSFFKFKDERDIPYDRAMASTDIFAQLEQGISKTYLKILFEGITEFLNDGKLVKASQLIKFAEDRLTHITHVDLLYQLASVVYLEEGEDPYKYNFEVGQQKIEFWRKHEKNIDAFFLKIRIVELLPSLATFQQDTHFSIDGMSLTDYAKAQSKRTEQELMYLSKGLSLIKHNQGLMKNIKSLIAKNTAILNYLK